MNAPPGDSEAPKRISLVAGQILGCDRTGGIGTAMSSLAAALARAGHRIEILYTSPMPERGLDPRWSARYEQLGVAITALGPRGGTVRPEYLQLPSRVLHALLDDPPDLVVAQDLGGPTALAERERRMGLAFPDTLFVVHCHGTSRWTADASNKVPTKSGRLATELLEQEAIEHANLVVSPSAYMLRWMREAGWAVPESALVVPYLTSATAFGHSLPAGPPSGEPIRRIAFFGRLDERKGIGPFLAGVSSVEARLLEGVELACLGSDTPRWPAERVRASLPAGSSVVVETRLDQDEALAELARPGTVAIMPSLVDNSPHTVIECLEHGVPFITSLVGGTGELLAAADAGRVAVEPTAEGVRARLSALLEAGTVPAPARPAVDADAVLAGWLALVAQPPTMPQQGHPAASSDAWLLHAEPGDELAAGAEERLRRAQAATGADVVTCGVEVGGETHLFLGEAGALGLLENAYGQTALVRSSLLDGESPSEPGSDPDWPFLAALSLGGAHIESIPEPLVRHRRPVGTQRSDPAGSLRVQHLFEHALPPRFGSLARLAAMLGQERIASPASRTPSGWRRLAARLRPSAASRIASRTGGKYRSNANSSR